MIIPKPHISSREGINSRYGRFDLLLLAVLTKSFAAMIAVVAAHVVKTGSAFRRYEQFETSPETIERELRPAVCEQRQTGLRRIIVD